MKTKFCVHGMFLERLSSPSETPLNARFCPRVFKQEAGIPSFVDKS